MFAEYSGGARHTPERDTAELAICHCRKAQVELCLYNLLDGLVFVWDEFFFRKLASLDFATLLKEEFWSAKRANVLSTEGRLTVLLCRHFELL